MISHPMHQGGRVLTCGDFVVELMDPHDYNRGVRFTPVAAILRATLGTNEFLYCDATPDPLTEVAGLFAEFDLVSSPPGFAEAKLGEGYVKVGVGVLKKDAPSYQFWPQHELLRPATTEVTWGAATARFHQICAPHDGYGYELDATVTVGVQTVVVDWQLKNIGSKSFGTQQYAHNCFQFNQRSVGPGYAVSFPYDFQARGLKKEQRQEERAIQFTAKITDPVNIEVDYPTDYNGANTVAVAHPESGLSVHCTTSARGLRTALHAAGFYVCPEQFIMIRLRPGETTGWFRQYNFNVFHSVQ